MIFINNEKSGMTLSEIVGEGHKQLIYITQAGICHYTHTQRYIYMHKYQQKV